MNGHVRIRIALSTNSTLLSQRSAVASCRAEHPADSQASRILLLKLSQNAPNYNAAYSSPHLPTAYPLYYALHHVPLINQNPYRTVLAAV